MTGALPKWEAALDTFDRIKHKFRAPGQIEKALNSIALDERVLLFRGSDADIVERLSWYDQVEGKCCLARACPFFYSLDVCTFFPPKSYSLYVTQWTCCCCCCCCSVKAV